MTQEMAITHSFPSSSFPPSLPTPLYPSFSFLTFSSSFFRPSFCSSSSSPSSSSSSSSFPSSSSSSFSSSSSYSSLGQACQKVLSAGGMPSGSGAVQQCCCHYKLCANFPTSQTDCRAAAHLCTRLPVCPGQEALDEGRKE